MLQQGITVVPATADYGICHHDSRIMGKTPLDSEEFPEMVATHMTNIGNMSVHIESTYTAMSRCFTDSTGSIKLFRKFTVETLRNL